jgi:hypothetical protein
MNETILKDTTQSYEIYFSHQYDNKSFNRGAVKNIGFIIAKKLYPEHYKNITFIFHDIDCLPYKNIFDYETEIGTVSHYYGFENSLGGIVVIKGLDFEYINGYINLYSWGQEDTSLQKRCEKGNLIIDRTNFYKIGSKEILQLFDGINRIINNKELNRVMYDDGKDGIRSIQNLVYTVDKVSKNKEDTDFIIVSDNIFVINIYNFLTKNAYSLDTNDFKSYDLRKPEFEIFKNNNRPVSTLNEDNDWTQIPMYRSIKPQVIYNNKTQNNILQRNNIQRNNIQRNNNIAKNTQVTASQIYSRSYATNNNIKPRASTSVKVGMGGIIIG